ncbi:MAG: polyprenyl synthetase family protein, partial [Candidatus Omnitrophota bacterium]|nr:polyprenyl synthetase family protein [Candidatus Omnitrophota bacterium]
KYKDSKIKKIINRLKTAKLFEASAKLGAIAADAKQKEISAMAKYGAYLGEAFQITDDIIDGESGNSVKDAEAAIRKSKEYLKIFGKPAKRLKSLADLVLARTK